MDSNSCKIRKKLLQLRNTPVPSVAYAGATPIIDPAHLEGVLCRGERREVEQAMIVASKLLNLLEQLPAMAD